MSDKFNMFFEESNLPIATLTLLRVESIDKTHTPVGHHAVKCIYLIGCELLDCEGGAHYCILDCIINNTKFNIIADRRISI